MIRRDFQFNVSTCERDFVADIEDNGVTASYERILTACGDTSLTIINRSTGMVTGVLWQFDMGNTTLTTTDWNPTIHFPGAGEYRGKYYINPGTNCADSLDLLIHVVEEIDAEFSLDYDTCIAGPVSFVDESQTIGSRIVSWDWDLAIGLPYSDRNPVAEYTQPGDYPIKLKIEDEYGCIDSVERMIEWKPVPPLVIIEPSAEDGCNPLDLSFVNLSTPIDDTYDIKWDFGDGNTGSGFQPMHTYLDTGTYTVKVEITSPIGCYTEREYKNLINVFHPPIADFDVSPLETDIFNPYVNLKDNSIYSKGREWQIEGGYFYDDEWTYEFKDTGRHVITLIAVDRFGCVDTLQKVVDVRPVNTFYFPNAFSPNNDGKNDLFLGKGLKAGIHDYTMRIYNRWGGLIYESDNLNEGWNGTLMNEGTRVETGVYIYQVEYKKARGEVVSEKNYINLIR